MGKKIKNIKEEVDQAKFFSLSEALSSIKKHAFAKFDESLEIAMNLNVDPRHSDQMVRGVVSLPAGLGKDIRVAVICKDDKFELAKSSGADIMGGLDLIENIKAGQIEFDVCIATPDMMGMVGQVARILGPKGLMPNPKLGTVTNDIASAVQNAKNGQVEYRVEKAGIIHAPLGKLSFSDENLLANAKTFISSVIKAKPSGAKGVYLKKISMSSTMGIGHKIDISTVS